jgi:acetyltransferase-like isoleucine patch superfamily enzyme
MAKDPYKRAQFLKNNNYNLGDNCEIFSSVSFGSEPYLIKCGNRVKITNGVNFITHDGGMYVLRNMGLLPDADKFGIISIGDNVFIGNNSTIMPGVNIGSNCVIGAGSIVTKDIPDNSVASGVPARVIKSIYDYYENNKEKTVNTKHMSLTEKKCFLREHYKNVFIIK